MVCLPMLASDFSLTHQQHRILHFRDSWSVPYYALDDDPPNVWTVTAVAKDLFFVPGVSRQGV
jgi:hypothetical protein